MQRKAIAFAGSILSGILSYTIPKCLEVFGVITQDSFWLPLVIVITVLMFIGVLIWGYFPEIKRVLIKKGGKNKMIVTIGLYIGGVGILCVIIGAVLALPRLSIPVKDVRIPLQIQLDTLIDDITYYSQTIPPLPLQNPNESWNDYTQKIITFSQKLNYEMAGKFNSKIIDTINKLHNFHIISDAEFQDNQQNITTVAVQVTITMILLPKLQKYKTDLDSFVQTWNAK
jgi:hypothetical protein